MNIPNEVMIQIVKHLNVYSILQLGKVNRKMNCICNDVLLWKFIYNKFYANKLKNDINYKLECKAEYLKYKHKIFSKINLKFKVDEMHDFVSDDVFHFTQMYNNWTVKYFN